MDPPECNGHSHDHGDHGDGSDSLGLSLRPQINFLGVKCLNEEIVDSGKAVLKLHEDRLSSFPSLRSPEDDAELLLYIPFTEAVTVQHLSVRSSGDSNSNDGNGGDNDDVETSPPRRVKIFVDRDDLDFETARELTPTAELELLPPHHFVEGTIDYPLRPNGRFTNISSIALFFVDNYSEEEESCTEITFVGLKGKGSRIKRGPVECVYETQGMAEDHKVKGDKQFGGFAKPGF